MGSSDELCQSADTEARRRLGSDCPPYASVNRRWSSSSGRCPSYLERSSATRHVSTVPSLAIFRSRLKTQLWLTAVLSCPRSEIVITDTLIRLIGFVTYLLTYLLTYYCIYVNKFGKYLFKNVKNVDENVDNIVLIQCATDHVQELNKRKAFLRFSDIVSRWKFWQNFYNKMLTN